MATFVDYRNAVKEALDHLLSRCVEEKRISEADAKQATEFINLNIEKLQNHAHIVHFLQTLTQKWPIFGVLYDIEKRKAQQMRDEAKAAPQQPTQSQPAEENIAPQIKELEKQLLNVIIQNLEEKKITQEDSQQISQYILDNIDELGSMKDVIDFTQKLTTKWPIFHNVSEIYEGKIERQEEVQTANEVAQLIKSGNVKQAISEAEQVIQE